ncbi:MAG: hypothetical protein LBJ92_03240 [Holosporales bacterium]|nr:hypothetical protein [Holosporales bacterium]
MEGKITHRPAVYLSVHQEADYGELEKKFIGVAHYSQFILQKIFCIHGVLKFYVLSKCIEYILFPYF